MLEGRGAGETSSGEGSEKRGSSGVFGVWGKIGKGWKSEAQADNGLWMIALERRYGVSPECQTRLFSRG